MAADDEVTAPVGEEYEVETPAEDFAEFGEEEDEATEVVIDLDDPNLCFALAADEEVGAPLLKKIGERIKADFDSDLDSSEEYRAKCTENWDLFIGKLKPKSSPWEDCANMHNPILLKHGSRIVNRMLAEVFGDFQNFHTINPVVGHEIPADTLTIHSNWQFRTQIKSFPVEMERLAYAMIVFGDATTHSYYDEESWTNVHETCTPDDFIVPYVYVSTKPDWSDVPRRTRILHWHRHKIQAMRGKWYDVDKVLDREASTDDEPETKMADASAQTSGIAKPDSDTNAEYKILMYEGWCELLEPVLGFKEPRDVFIQAYVDYATGHVLQLRIHEEDDWRDAERHNLESKQLQSYQAQMEQWAMAVETRQAYLDAGLADPSTMGAEPPSPTPPEWFVPGEVEEPAPVRRVPISMFTHVKDIENLHGSLGIGHGRVLADLNRFRNTVTNQFVDAASLGNAGGYFTTLDMGEIVWGPGAMNKVEGYTPEELKAGLFPMSLPKANPQLLEVGKIAEEEAESVMHAGSVLSGEPGKSGEAWHALSARIEQATKQLSVVAQKLKRHAKYVVENNCKLNYLYLPEHEIVMVADHLLGSLPIEVGRDMYGARYAIEISADLRFATQSQRVAEADNALQMAMQIPPLQQRPDVLIPLIIKTFEARGLYDIVKILKSPPPPMPQPVAPPQGQPQPGAQGGGPAPPRPQQAAVPEAAE